MKQIFSLPKWYMVLTLAGIVTFSSCKKDSSSNNNATDSDLVTDAVESDAVSEDQFNNVFNITMGVQSSDAGEDVGIGTGAGIIYKPSSPEGTLSPDSARCFTVTVTPKTAHVFPKTVTVDFGTGCLGKDGKLRKGKIISVYTGPMFVAGNSVTTTFDNYNVDSFKIEGTHKIENKSTSNNLAWSVTVTDGKITNTLNNNWRKWSGTREHKQTEGNGTPLNLLDDVFEITGSASGSNSRGNSWTSDIITPVVRKLNCRWLESGKVQITRNSNPNAAILDFGDGTCDAKATITYKGVVYNISLR